MEFETEEDMIREWYDDAAHPSIKATLRNISDGMAQVRRVYDTVYSGAGKRLEVSFEFETAANEQIKKLKFEIERDIKEVLTDYARWKDDRIIDKMLSHASLPH